MMAALYDVSVSAINQHLKKIFNDNELDENSVIKKYLITANDGKSYNTKYYNLQAIIAVGFKVNNERAVQFRKWANQIIKDFTIKGWAMDDERLKNSGTKLTKDYFEKLLIKIREIRLSERKFYQKITDIYATSLDYDQSAKATKRFLSAIQNKLHYSIHGKTAAELIVDRANQNEEKLNQMQRIVSAYLDMAEMQAERHIPMTMEDWKKRLNGFLQLWDKEILNDAGKVSAALAKKHAESEFEKYRIIQDRLYKSDFDKFLELEDNTKDLEK